MVKRSKANRNETVPRKMFRDNDFFRMDTRELVLKIRSDNGTVQDNGGNPETVNLFGHKVEKKLVGVWQSPNK